MKAAARANAKAVIQTFNFGEYLANNIDQRYPYEMAPIAIGYQGKYSCESTRTVAHWWPSSMLTQSRLKAKSKSAKGTETTHSQTRCMNTTYSIVMFPQPSVVVNIICAYRTNAPVAGLYVDSFLVLEPRRVRPCGDIRLEDVVARRRSSVKTSCGSGHDEMIRHDQRNR